MNPEIVREKLIKAAASAASSLKMSKAYAVIPTVEISWWMLVFCID